MTIHRLAKSITLAAVVLVALTSAACAGAAQPGAPADVQGPAAPKVNRLVFGIGPPNKESNRPPVMGVGTSAQLMPIYDYLVGMSPEGDEAIPQLATSWQIEPDGKSYRFKLKQGVPFHRGMGEFSAKDVRFTWEVMKNETEVMSPQPTRVVRQDIKDVEIINDYEVVFRLAEANSGIFSALSQAEHVFPIQSKADGDSRQRPPTMEDMPLASTGSYQFLKREQAQYIRFQAVPGHWRHTPDFPEFEWRYIKEASTMLASLLANESHLGAITPDLMPQAVKSGMRAIAGRAPGQQAWLTFHGIYINKRTNPDEKLNPDPNATFVHPDTPLLDVRVRKALNKAIDRDALNKAFLAGKGETMYITYLHRTRPGWNPAWENNFKQAYGYDPEEAKKLLAEAGYGPNNPLSTTVQLRPYAYFPGVLDMDEAIANFWRAIGINAKLEQYDPVASAAKGRALEFNNHSSILVTGIRQWLGPDQYNSILGGTRGGAQFPELDEVYGEIRKTLDAKRYDELWRKWGDIAYDRYANGPLFWLPTETAVNPNIVGEYVYPGSVSYIYTHVEYIKPAK